MSPFQHEISSRISETQDNLALAHAAGDDYLVGVRLGELESPGQGRHRARPQDCRRGGVEESWMRPISLLPGVRPDSPPPGGATSAVSASGVQPLQHVGEIVDQWPAPGDDHVV